METIVVMGLGRCGSSLVMQMLAASGFPTVGEHPAYEDVRVNLMDTRALWEGEWRGKAVKVLDPHRCDLHLAETKIIWLSRDLKQQALSIDKFAHFVCGMPLSNRQELKLLEKSLKRDTDRCLRLIRVTDPPLLKLRFEDLILGHQGEGVSKLARFVGGNIPMMQMVVRPRTAACYPGFLETELFI